MRMSLALICGLCLLLRLSGAGAADLKTPPPPGDESEYSITVIPFYSPEKIWNRYTPLVDYLRESTGKPWVLKLYTSHDKLIEGLCSGKVSLALLGPVPLGRVMEKCAAEPIAVALGKDGSPFYHSVVVTAEEGITSLEELRGRKFGLFKGSTAAHILPRKLLLEAGLEKSDFESVYYESQDHLVNALLAHQIAAAGLKDVLFKKFQGEGLRILKSSEPLPNFAFAAAPGATPAVRALFTKALLELHPRSNDLDAKRVADWDDEVKNGFILPTTAFRASVKEIATLTNEIMRADQ